MRRVVRVASVFAWLVALPTVAFAQAVITGVVRDSSGAVLPGVTVNATSPVLIEQVRTAVSDSSGQYRIVDLRPGTYVVTFELTGFSSLKREGIELSGDFVATVNADLRVGSVQETITVTGESPVVDVQSSQTSRTLSADAIAGIPSSRNYQSFTVLMPGINVQGADVGGQSGGLFSVFQAHGGRRNEGQVQLDGLSAGWQGMGVSGYSPEVGAAEEVTFAVTGGLGEAATGGPQMNLIPRQGGNRFSGTTFVGVSGDAWQGSNLNAEHIAAGLAAQGEMIKLWDVNLMFGGPIKQDKLWFFWTARHQGTRNKVAGIFINRNAGDITKWTYDPDPTQQAEDDNTTKNMSLRLTWQVSPRNKFSIWWDEQETCQSCIGGGSSGLGPLAGGVLAQEADGGNYNPIRMAQATWTSPVTSRVLVEGAFGLGPRAWFGSKPRAEYNPELISVVESAGSVPGIEYRGQNGPGNYARNYGEMYTIKGALSYITGAHRMKVGVRWQHTNAAFISYYNNYRLRYTFGNTVPTQLRMFGNHAADNPFQMDTTALFAQDQWTLGRLTLQGGLRFERITSYYPEASFGPELFIPTRLVFPAQKGDLGPKDLDPRFGASYDVFGNGKTALKASLGRYPTPTNSYEAYGLLQQPANRVASFTDRSWADANGNRVADCDMLNPNLNGECGPWTNQNFGKYFQSTTYDDSVNHGWNVREYSWDLAIGLQQQLAPRVSAEINYVRRSWGNQVVTDNRAYSRSDFDRFSLTAPVDSRLPDGGGYRVNGVYELKADRPFGLVDNLVTHAKNYGDYIERYNGVDFTVNARLRSGLQMQGGINTGRSTRNDCAVMAQVPEALTTFGLFRRPEDFCDQSSGFQTGGSALATYTVPKIDVQLAGTFSTRPFAGANFPGIESQSLIANWFVTNAQVQPELGRPMVGNAFFTFVNIVDPGTLYGDRLNQVDFRVSKILRFGRTRTNVGLDFFNLLNSSAVSQYLQTYSGNGAAWLRPSALLSARFMKFSAQMDF